MTVCQICGDKGYSKLLSHCVQCQNVAVHRYCVLGPSIFEDEKINWSCENCDPSKTEPTVHKRKSERLISTAQRKLRNKLCPPQSEKQNVSQKETAKGDTDRSVLDQKNRAGNVKRKQVKLKENGSPGHQRVKLGKNVGPLLSKVEDHVNERTCTMGDGTQGGSKLAKQQNLTGCSVPKKEVYIDKSIFTGDEKGCVATSLDKSSCEVFSEPLAESRINKNQPLDAELGHSKNNKSGDFVQSNHGVCETQAPRKKRKFVIEMEYSDEDPVFVVAKHPHLVRDVGKDPSSKSTSEAHSKLNDDSFAQLSSVESVPRRPSPLKVDDRVLTLESSAVFDNHIPAQPLLNLVQHVPAQPLVDPAWSGYCRISHNEYPMSLRLEAHLSNKAHEKAQGAVRALPELLNFHLVSKEYAWPKTFEKSPPTADIIGLYFFPFDVESERLYECLVDKMIEHGLVLKSVINYLELLVFCSLELPLEEQSFQRKYYLWGVFKPRKDPIIPNHPSNIHHISNVQMPAICPKKDLGSAHFRQEDTGESVELTRPISKPLSRSYDKQGHDIHHQQNRNSIIPNNPSNIHHISNVQMPAIYPQKDSGSTHFRHEAMGESVELTRPISKPLSRAYDKQGRDIHHKRNRNSIIPNNPSDIHRISNVQMPAIYPQKDSGSTHFREEAMGESVELTRPISKPLSRAYDKQGCDIHHKQNRNSNVRHRKGYNSCPREIGKPQDHEHRHHAEPSDYGKQNHNYRKHSDRWNKQSKKCKSRVWKESGESHKLYRSNKY